MTTEEKAKAYDEALERAKSIVAKFRQANMDAYARVDQILPELFESKDERIIKTLQEYVKNRNWALNGPTQAEVLGWLEKQKVFSNGEGLYYYHQDGNCTFMGTGLGPIEGVTINGEPPKTENNSVDLPDSVEINGIGVMTESGDERIRKAIVGLIEELQRSDRYFAGVELTDMLAYLEKQKEEEGYEAIPVESTLEYKLGFKAGKESEKQKEQNPISQEDFDTAKHEATWGEQQPVEWSEEDEDMLNRCISSIEEARDYRYYYKETDGDTSYDEETAWLKDIFLNHKKFNEAVEKLCSNEWSEEDEDFINMLILHFNYLIDKGGDSVGTYKSYIKKLKSLSPQPKQEWSKDALMEWLKEKKEWYEGTDIEPHYQKVIDKLNSM